MLDPGAVVPTAVEDDNLPGSRQMGDITLKIPLSPLDIRRFAERHQAHSAWVEWLGDTLDGAAFARCIPPFKDQTDALTTFLHPVLKTDQFKLQACEFILIKFTGQLRRWSGLIDRLCGLPVFPALVLLAHEAPQGCWVGTRPIISRL